MDLLSQVIALLKPQAVGWRVVEAHDAWTLCFPPHRDIVVFGQALEGVCEVVREDRPAFTLAAGDFMLMASPPRWTMQAHGGGRPVEFKALLAGAQLLTVPDNPQATTRFIAGRFTFARSSAELLAKLVLPTIHIRGAHVAAGRLGALLALLRDEALSERPGRSLVLERLLEVVLVEVLRHRQAGLDGAQRGLLAGLADPQIGRALRLMHEDAKHPWTVEALARDVGMSRSAFAARFMETVGSPPIEYLATWRMTLAKQALALAEAPMVEVAELAGYQSVSAFSTAFRRVTGLSPTAYIQSLA